MNGYLLLVFALCSTLKGELFTQQPAWNYELDLDKIEYELQKEPIIKLVPMRRYLKRQGKVVVSRSAVYLAILENGLKAVFKPEDRPFFAYGEIAAYRASKWLGQRLVPPTVFKQHESMSGSLQFFIETPFDLLKPRQYRRAFKLIPFKIQSNMTIFYFIFWGRATHRGNQLIARGNDGSGYLALIDNAQIMVSLHVQQAKLPHWQKVTFPSKYSLEALKRYGELNLEVLKWIFEDALKENPTYCSLDFFNGILKRRDYVLNKSKKVTVA